VPERFPEQPLDLGVAREALLERLEAAEILLAGTAQRLTRQPLADGHHLAQRRHVLEDDEIPSEDEARAALVVERAGEDVNRRAQG
jgi:hypothetical protein